MLEATLAEIMASEAPQQVLCLCDLVPTLKDLKRQVGQLELATEKAIYERLPF
jgi:hypothetical protein